MALRKISYGAPTDKSADTVRLGAEMGFFAEEGLDLSVEVVFGGPEISAAYASGQLQIGELGSPPAITAIAAGSPFTIVASGLRQRAHMYFGVRTGIDSFEQLRGKRLGLLGIGSCPDWVARKILAHHGLGANDVTFVPLLHEYPRIIEILAEGRIDACMAMEPNMSVGEEGGLLEVWAAGFEQPYLPDFQWEVRVARDDLIATDPELVRAVLRGCRRSVQFAATHPDDWAAFATRHFGINPEATQRAIARELPHVNTDCRLNMAGLQVAADMQHELGGIPQPMEAAEFVDLQFQV